VLWKVRSKGSRGDRVHVHDHVVDDRATALHHYLGLNFQLDHPRREERDHDVVRRIWWIGSSSHPVTGRCQRPDPLGTGQLAERGQRAGGTLYPPGLTPHPCPAVCLT
jgi:hypothetical protein